jgi:predicted NBD/HSP70 family sugar kinase
MRNMTGASDRRQVSATLAVLRAVQREPGVERATVGRVSGLASGFVAETVARLRQLELISERPAPPRGGRGRPTTTLHPHALGPLVVAIAVAHETWRLAVVELGGKQLTHVQETHQRDADEVLASIRAELRSVRRRHGRRLRAVAVAVPGTVSGERLVQAPNLGWHDLDLGQLWGRDQADRPVLVGNDASFAAVAEAAQGSAAGVGTSLHLFIDAGVGGAFIDHGRLLSGANGMAGEFGHMPFGHPDEPCRCGARGCWNTTLDGTAIARALGHAAPTDDVTFTRRVMTSAQTALSTGARNSRELEVIQEVARSVGRGAAGLVNAMDPEIVTLGGMGRDLLAIADVQLQPAYLLGLMQQRTSPPPPLVPAHFGDDAPLIGAAEEAINAVLTDAGITRWTEALSAIRR